MLGHIALHGCARSPEPCHPHTRSDLTSQLRAARSKWWIRNASVRDVLAALTEDTAGAMSEHGGLAPSPSNVSPAKAAEVLDAYKTLRVA